LKNLFFVLFLIFGACSTTGLKKTILDSSGEKPKWVNSSKVVYFENDKILYRGSYTIKGNERVDACYDLAKLNSKEMLVSEIQTEIKGVIDNSIYGLSEQAEVVLGKSRSVEFAGTISGFRVTEQYFERYSVAEKERVDCYVLSEITKTDYNKTKSLIIDKVQEADPKIKEAIRNKHVDFFSNSN